jgi:flagellar hook-length control protein FliK
MQNLPIATNQPTASSAQALAVTDNNGADPSEPFDAVLARQISDTTATDNSPIVSFGPIALDADTAATALVAPPADMLAALLPDATGGGTAAPGNTLQKKTDPREKIITDATAMNGMLAGTMLVAPQPANHIAAAQGEGATAQPVAIAASEIKNSAQQPSEFHTKPVPFHIPNNIAIATGDHAVRPDSFPAKLMGSLEGNAAPPAQNSIQPAQTDDATTLPISVQGNPAPPVPAAQNGSAQLAVNTPITQDGWGREFNQQITWLATQHQQSAELHLNPPHLGPLDVVLNVNGDQATALFTSPHSAVRDAVAQALPRLREMMAESGIMLGNATVSDQAPRDQTPFNSRQTGSGAWSGRNADIAPVAAIQTSGTAWPIRRQQGMVDTFV